MIVWTANMASEQLCFCVDCNISFELSGFVKWNVYRVIFPVLLCGLYVYRKSYDFSCVDSYINHLFWL